MNGWIDRGECLLTVVSLQQGPRGQRGPRGSTGKSGAKVTSSRQLTESSVTQKYDDRGIEGIYIVFFCFSEMSLDVDFERDDIIDPFI